MLKSTFKIILVFLMSGLAIQAQDIHFSQFYASPLTLNPAMTGFMQECHRVSVNYRNQYPQLYTYNTFAVAYDGKLMQGMLRNDFAGAGLLFYNDKQGDGNLNNMQIMGSAAYHKAIDPDGRVFVSVGVQGGWVNKSVDIFSLTFAQQFDASQQDFDVLAPNGEAFENNQFSYFDLRAGAMVSANISDLLGVFGGFSYFHLFEPEETFLVNDVLTDVNTLDSRLVAHLGADIKPNRNVSINPHFLFMTQAGAREIVFGSNVGYHFAGSRNSDGTAIFGGLAYRLGDNIIALVGAEFNSLKIGISYDVNASALKTASNGQGGIEMSVGYKLGCTSRGRRSYPPVSCPRF